MKKINEGFYEIKPELYAERRQGSWFITNEAEVLIAGPFDTLEDLAAAHGATITSGLQEVTNNRAQPEVAVTLEQAQDLVTLREAAQFLPITRQGLEYRRKHGSLGVEPVVTGRSTELYSLRALKEAFPS